MKQDNSYQYTYTKEEEVPTVPFSEVMSEEFIAVYRDALRFSKCDLDHQLKFRNVAIFEKDHIHELYTKSSVKLPHLVLLHGYGGTSLTFIRTFEHLKNHFQVHALDTFGVGLSSKGDWKDQKTPEQTKQYYIEAVEQWRKKLGIESFILAGHSFGGYISTLYFEKYNSRVEQLLLLSPAGSTKMTDQTIQQRARNSKIFFCIAQLIYNRNIRPFRMMNTFIIGNKFIDRILTNRLKLQQDEKQAWKNYLKRIIKIPETSEQGFYNLFEWPLQPHRSIEEILRSMNSKKKIDILFGDTDWMNKQGATRLAKDYQNINVHEIKDSGHQLVFDNPVQLTEKIRAAVAQLPPL